MSSDLVHHIRSARTARLTAIAALLAAVVMLALMLRGSSPTVAQAEPIDPADLALTKSDSPDPVNQNAVLTYTIQVTNNGPDPATNVVVSDNLPGGVEFISASTSQGTCVQQGGKVGECQLGELANGATATVTVKVNVKKKKGSISNTASVTSDVVDPNPDNNKDTEETKVIEATGPTCFGKTATIVGTPGNDTLNGTEQKDVIVAKAGDDQVFALGHSDLVCARGGNDFVSGGAKSDRVKGGAGRDRLVGRGGGDELRGNRGGDRLRGNRGPDLLAGGRGFDRCRGGPGNDTLRSC